MNWKSFIAGAGIGLAGGLAIRGLLEQKTVVSPEKALSNAKSAFRKHGPISGSWIQMKAETYRKGPLLYEVYKGGISRLAGEHMEQYEFISDAKTGAIIETNKLY